MKPIKIGIVGFGKMGILHAGILNALPNCEVTAICEKEPLMRKLASKLAPKIHYFETPFDMVSSEQLDAVYVTTPISGHRYIVEDIARASNRLGLFIEKPLAKSVDDGQSIIDAASKFASTCMVGFQKRFLPQFTRAQKLLRLGVLGETTVFKGYSYLESGPSKKGGWRFKKGEGGALLDLGPHIIDMIIWYFGTPTSVTAVESSLSSKYVEDAVQIEFGFQSGISGRVEVSWRKEGYRLPYTGLEISGSNGTIKVSDDFLELDLLCEIRGLAKSGRTILVRPQITGGVPFLLGDPEYCREDQSFLYGLRSGKTVTPNFDDGLEVNKVIQLAHASAGGSIQIA